MAFLRLCLTGFALFSCIRHDSSSYLYRNIHYGLPSLVKRRKSIRCQTDENDARYTIVFSLPCSLTTRSDPEMANGRPETIYDKIAHEIIAHSCAIGTHLVIRQHVLSTLNLEYIPPTIQL